MAIDATTERGNALRVKAVAFGKGLEAVLPFAELEQGHRPVLSLLRLRIHADSVEIAAANPYALAEVRVVGDSKQGLDAWMADAYLSRTTARILARTIRDFTRSVFFGKKISDGVLELAIGAPDVTLQLLAGHQAQRASIVFRAVDQPEAGPYPDIDKVKPWVMETPRAACEHMSFSPEIFEAFRLAAKALREPGDVPPPIGLVFYGPLAPIEVRVGRDCRGVLMPVRAEL